MTDLTDNNRFEASLAAEREREREALWAMTPEQREAAMWRRELSFFQLIEWSSQRPHEVPRLPTGMTGTSLTSGGGEFAWIVMNTPEWAESGDVVRELGR